MSYRDIIGEENLTDEARRFIEKSELESKTIARLRKEIKELNEDIPKIFNGNYSSTTKNTLFYILERKEKMLKNILENGLQ